MMDELLQKVKENLILEHDAGDKLLERYITAAISYAESYQHIAAGYYQEHPMPPTTEQASSCCHPTSTSPGMAARAAFSQITCRPVSRCGTP